MEKFSCIKPSCDGSAETGPINGQCSALGLCCTPGNNFLSPFLNYDTDRKLIRRVLC